MTLTGTAYLSMLCKKYTDRKLKAAEYAFDASLNLGINFIDTAEVYGSRLWLGAANSESLLGRIQNFQGYIDGLGDAIEQGLVKAWRFKLIWAPEENGVKAACDELGITLIMYSPIAQGKYTLENPPTGPRGHIYTPDVLKLVVLNWLIAQENVVPISGAKNAEEAEEFAGALGWRFSNEEISEQRSLASLLVSLLKTYNRLEQTRMNINSFIH